MGGSLCFHCEAAFCFPTWGFTYGSTTDYSPSSYCTSISQHPYSTVHTVLDPHTLDKYVGECLYVYTQMCSECVSHCYTVLAISVLFRPLMVCGQSVLSLQCTNTVSMDLAYFATHICSLYGCDTIQCTSTKMLTTHGIYNPKGLYNHRDSNQYNSLWHRTF